MEVYMRNIAALLNVAITEANNLNFGKPFLIKDLFKGCECTCIPTQDRLLLRTLFLSH